MQKKLSNLDAQEVYLRGLASQRISALPQTHWLAQEAIERQRRKDYDTKRAQLLRDRNNATRAAYVENQPVAGAASGVAGSNDAVRLSWWKRVRPHQAFRRSHGQ